MGRSGVMGHHPYAPVSAKLCSNLRPRGSPLQATSSVVAWLAAACSTSGVPTVQYQVLREEELALLFENRG